MNYYVGYFYHCWRVVFNHFKVPYCAKWGNLLQEMVDNCDDITIKEDSHGKVHTVDFNYKHNVYEVWVCNGFYAAGYLYRFNGRCTSSNTQKLPSFKLQSKLLQMVIDYKNKLEQEDIRKFEKELYRNS